MNSKLSIIIPIYNVEKYLHQCLDSILNQTYDPYEIICINDGSTDNSLTILKEYVQKSEKIKIITQPNKGLSGARNAGIKAAKGEYLFFLDSDDWIEENALQILVEKITDKSDLICFNGCRYFEDGRTEEPDAGITENNLTGWEYYNKYALQNRKFHFVCSVLRLYRREFLLENNLFFKEGIYHEDNLFTPIVCYYAKSVQIIPDCLYVYRIREGSISQTLSEKRILDTIKVANDLANFFISKSNIEKEIVYREISGEYFSIFMPEKRKGLAINGKDLKKQINWDNFKAVSIYPRHKRIFRLLSVHPKLFQIYFRVEVFTKKIKKRRTQGKNTL